MPVELLAGLDWSVGGVREAMALNNVYASNFVDGFYPPPQK